MKQIISVNILLFTIFVVTLCSTEKDYNYLPDLQINIPENLQNNPDAVSFITDNTYMLNNWSKTFENFVVECNPYTSKNEKELTIEEREKFGKIMIEFVAGMGKFKVDVSKMQKDADYLKCELSKDEITSLNKVMKIFNSRAKVINDRYFNFDKKL